MKRPLDHVKGEFERRDPERDPLDDHAPGRTTMSASPHCPPLELESDRLRHSGVIAQQSHDGDSKPQQQADGHEGERYEQVEGSDGRRLALSSRRTWPDLATLPRSSGGWTTASMAARKPTPSAPTATARMGRSRSQTRGASATKPKICSRKAKTQASRSSSTSTGRPPPGLSGNGRRVARKEEGRKGQARQDRRGARPQDHRGA